MKDINKKLLLLAFNNLLELDLKDIESIEISNNKYSDTNTLSIEVSYIQGKDIG